MPEPSNVRPFPSGRAEEWARRFQAYLGEASGLKAATAASYGSAFARLVGRGAEVLQDACTASALAQALEAASGAPRAAKAALGQFRRWQGWQQ